MCGRHIPATFHVSKDALCQLSDHSVLFSYMPCPQGPNPTGEDATCGGASMESGDSACIDSETCGGL